MSIAPARDDDLAPASGDVDARCVTALRMLAVDMVVPIVEPEVLMDGGHSLARGDEVTREVLAEVFAQLRLAAVDLTAMVLKPSMVIAGTGGPASTVDEVAAATIRCLRDCVPASVPGIAFLSGGQAPEVATLISTPWCASGHTRGGSRSPTAGRCRTTRCAPGRVPARPRRGAHLARQQGSTPTARRRSAAITPPPTRHESDVGRAGLLVALLGARGVAWAS